MGKIFKNILVATDGSEHALRAAIKAAGIAKMNPEAIITVLFVVDGATSKSDVLSEGSKEALQEKRLRKIRPTEEILKKAKCEFYNKNAKG